MGIIPRSQAILELSALSCDELRVICKNEHLSFCKNHKRIRKEEMVQKIVEARMYNKKSVYINSLSEGMLIAFVCSDGKARTAKVIRKSTTDRVVEVETEYGARFIVNFDDILWVKTGTRWPKFVYEMLKCKN